MEKEWHHRMILFLARGQFQQLFVWGLYSLAMAKQAQQATHESYFLENRQVLTKWRILNLRIASCGPQHAKIEGYQITKTSRLHYNGAYNRMQMTVRWCAILSVPLSSRLRSPDGDYRLQSANYDVLRASCWFSVLARNKSRCLVSFHVWYSLASVDNCYMKPCGPTYASYCQSL